MTNECVFQLIKASLFGNASNITDDYDWLAIFKELNVQALLGIPWEYVNIHHMCPSDIWERWDNRYMYNQVIYDNLFDVQNQITALLQEIPHCIIKGTSAGCYYKNLYMRSYGDIDILVHPDCFDKALNILIQYGFELQEDDDRHVDLEFNGVEVELHRFFSNYKVDGEGHDFDEYLNLSLSESILVKMDHCSFYKLPDVPNGLVLLNHIKQHLSSGLGLRQIIDWMLYVDHVLDDSLWENEFCLLAREFGMERLAINVTRMCQMYLGLDQHLTWCDTADEKVCDNLMKYIMDRGNFGAKDGNSTRRVMQVLTTESFFLRLKEQGINNWSLARKYPFLRSFAWLYQLGRYICLGFQREKPLKTLFNDLKDSRERNKMFKQLMQ